MKIRVGGVPEHFNLAWHLAIENKLFEKAGITVEWVDVPGGTGAMCKALREGDFDIAVALTEGIINDIVHGNPSKVVQFFVNSPLRWGIFTNAQSSINTINDMQGHKYAISRYKSGSHLMAYVNANKHHLNIADNDFVLVGNLDGARKALANDEAQLFMWEKYMTKPYVDNGEFKMIGECNTPWPCFVIAASNHFISSHAEVLNKVLNIINLSCLTLKNNSKAPELIAKRYDIKLEDAFQWFKELEYAYHPEMNVEQLEDITAKLIHYNILDAKPNLESVFYVNNIEYA
jgi:sulfonate transport system substrate-binding protein